jgi:hypothetical protein
VAKSSSNWRGGEESEWRVGERGGCQLYSRRDKNNIIIIQFSLLERLYPKFRMDGSLTSKGELTFSSLSIILAIAVKETE